MARFWDSLYCWCRQRQWVKTASGRKRFNVLGALHATTRRVLRRESEGSVNAVTVCSLLVDLHNQHEGSSVRITVVLDNVPYHRARLVRAVADLLDIELLFLPPYSPNLNLIERVWKRIKKLCLSNRYYEAFERFKDAIRTGIEAINGEDSAEVASLFPPSSFKCSIRDQERYLSTQQRTAHDHHEIGAARLPLPRIGPARIHLCLVRQIGFRTHPNGS
ncbi:MAG: IS630 family transposase [Verrucomicrobia bacterium]|nr:MAG: IS630 family transposase [Verrucomicrobiota bacterium]